MKNTHLQFDLRENTASSRQHAPRLPMNASVLQSDLSCATELPPDEGAHEPEHLIREKLELSSTEPEPGKSATGGGKSRTITRAWLGDAKRSTVERPLTCEEAAELVRVHPKTVKRMARAGELPGHFRFGRWFFYASELDSWMRTELHSARHSCR